MAGPVGDPVEAVFGLVPGPRGPTGVVEMALASGLALAMQVIAGVLIRRLGRVRS